MLTARGRRRPLGAYRAEGSGWQKQPKQHACGARLAASSIKHTGTPQIAGLPVTSGSTGTLRASGVPSWHEALGAWD